MSAYSGSPCLFQSTHPVRGGTFPGIIGIGSKLVLQSTHPVRGGTARLSAAVTLLPFQSTHPVRGGTAVVNAVKEPPEISIHPPREGWDLRTSIKPSR